MAEIDPKVVEESDTSVKISEIKSLIGQFSTIKALEPPTHVDNVVDLELEEHCEEIQVPNPVDDGPGTSNQRKYAVGVEKPNAEEEYPIINECCIWKSCKSCDELKSEKSNIESVHFVEIKEVENRLDSAIKELSALKQVSASQVEELNSHKKTKEEQKNRNMMLLLIYLVGF